MTYPHLQFIQRLVAYADSRFDLVLRAINKTEFEQWMTKLLEVELVSNSQQSN